MMKTRLISALKYTKKVALMSVALSLVLSLIPSYPAAAASNQLFVTPSSLQMSKDTTFCIDVKSYADSDANPGTVIGSIVYPTDKLRVVSGSIKTGSSTCGSPASSHYGTHSVGISSGKLSFNASKANAEGGISQIFTVKFKAIAGGIASIKFTTDSKVNNTSTSFNNGTFTINSPTPPKKTPKPSSTPSTPATPSPTPNPQQNNNGNNDDNNSTPVPDPTGTISNVSIDSAYDTATITWTVRKSNSKSAFQYGTDSINLDKTANVTKQSSDTFSTKLTNLAPGSQYYFMITASGGGDKGEYSSVIYTRGFPVVITVTENNIPAANATVRLGNINNSTDSNGKLALALAAGDYSGTITTNTATLNISLSVAAKPIPTDGSAPETQTASFNLSSSILDQGPGSEFSVLMFIGILAIGTVVLGAGFLIFVAYRRRRFDMDDSTKTIRQTVVIDDGFDWKNFDPSKLQQPSVRRPQPPSSSTSPKNSVHLDEEEPKDMFDFDNKPTADEPPKKKEGDDEGAGINISR